MSPSDTTCDPRYTSTSPGQNRLIDLRILPLERHCNDGLSVHSLQSQGTQRKRGRKLGSKDLGEGWRFLHVGPHRIKKTHHIDDTAPHHLPKKVRVVFTRLGKRRRRGPPSAQTNKKGPERRPSIHPSISQRRREKVTAARSHSKTEKRRREAWNIETTNTRCAPKKARRAPFSFCLSNEYSYKESCVASWSRSICTKRGTDWM